MDQVMPGGMWGMGVAGFIVVILAVPGDRGVDQVLVLPVKQPGKEPSRGGLSIAERTKTVSTCFLSRRVFPQAGTGLAASTIFPPVFPPSTARGGRFYVGLEYELTRLAYSDGRAVRTKSAQPFSLPSNPLRHPNCRLPNSAN